jgi:hypothetical protein
MSFIKKTTALVNPSLPTTTPNPMIILRLCGLSA